MGGFRLRPGLGLRLGPQGFGLRLGDLGLGPHGLGGFRLQGLGGLGDLGLGLHGLGGFRLQGLGGRLLAKFQLLAKFRDQLILPGPFGHKVAVLLTEVAVVLRLLCVGA